MMKSSLHPAIYIVSWIFFSNLTIIFNKWLLDTAGFRYPLTLTTLHLATSSIILHLLARFTPLLSSRHDVPLSAPLYFRRILPIGLLYTISLSLSNLTYLYLSVSFIQILKAGAPVITLLLAWALGIASTRSPARSQSTLLAIVLVIAGGVALSSLGEGSFSLVGFLIQNGATAAESGRLLLIQVLLSDGEEGVRMDPLVGLYYYAPPCALLNGIVAALIEAPNFDTADVWRVGVMVLLANSLVAFALNVASVMLIGKSSALTMNLTGIFKSILLVAVSLVIWPAPISPLQVVGYAIALTGLFFYSMSPGDWAHVEEATAWISDKLRVGGDGGGIRRRMGSRLGSGRYEAVPMEERDMEAVPLTVRGGEDLDADVRAEQEDLERGEQKPRQQVRDGDGLAQADDSARLVKGESPAGAGGT